jgi:peptidyl-prolyl cis-trans isomerase B (cyclophilin B)
VQGQRTGVPASRRAALAVAGVLVLLGACGRIPVGDPLGGASPSEPGTADSPSGSTRPSTSGSAPPGSGTCEYTVTGQASRPVQPPSPTGVPESGTSTATVQITGGTLRITLDRVRAPCTVHSFESLARQGFYDGTRCHRLADSGIFVLQCGDPTGTGSGGPGYTFADETDGTETYTDGVVAMANAGPNTNGSQFFLVYGDSSSLEPNYTVFGHLDEASLAVVSRIAAQGQDASNPDGTGRPLSPAAITRVTVS